MVIGAEISTVVGSPNASCRTCALASPVLSVRPLWGFAVTPPCTDDPTKPYTELLIGLGAVGGDGGGWRGVDIGYTVGGRHRVTALGQGRDRTDQLAVESREGRT